MGSHFVTLMYVTLVQLQVVERFLKTPGNVHLLSMFGKEISSLIVNCKQMIRDASKICRKLNQSVQRNLMMEIMISFNQAIEENLFEHYPLWPTTQKAVVIVKEIITYCNGISLYTIHDKVM